MNHHNLSIYLCDHLAGSTLAMDLLRELSGKHAGEKFGQAAKQLLVEIEQDRKQLQRLMEKVGAAKPGFKQMLAHFLAKLGRFKFHRARPDPLGTFEAWETIALGILGKEGLWCALERMNDARLRGFDYAWAIERARAQHACVEALRLEAAGLALSI